MLAAVVVHLQAERRAGLDLDALDLEARSLLDHRVGAPGPVHRAVQLVRLVAAGLELGINMFHILRATLVRHQQRIGRVDDDQVVQAHRAHQPLAAVDGGVAGVV